MKTSARGEGKGEARVSGCARGTSARPARLTQALLDLQLVLEQDAVRDLLVLLDEVELLDQDRVVLEAVLADLEQDLDHEQHALLDGALVQDRAEALKDDVGRLGRVLRQEQADLARERARNLKRVGRRVLLQEQEDLQRQELVRDRLVDEVGDKRGRGDADGLGRGGTGAQARESALQQGQAVGSAAGRDEGDVPCRCA